MNSHLTDTTMPPVRNGRWREMREAAARRPPPQLAGKILYLERITVSFDGFKALDALTLYVDPGELRCVIGPNGAGKTTMMDVITGKTRPDEGSAWFGRNVDLLRLTEPEIAQAGIGRKFQKPTVFEALTVFENLELALAGPKSFWRMLVARLTPLERERIDEVLEVIGLAPQRAGPGRRAVARPEAVAGDRHAADAAAGAAARRRTGGRDDAAGDGAHRGAAAVAVGQALGRRRRARHGVRAVDREPRHRAARGPRAGGGEMDTVQNDPRVIEVYLGA